VCRERRVEQVAQRIFVREPPRKFGAIGRDEATALP
jgi:hypothetical protein